LTLALHLIFIKYHFRLAQHFDAKIKSILDEITIDDQVFNGEHKIAAANGMFMHESSIKECLSSLKSKNSKGFVRIPQKVLIGGAVHLINLLTPLLDRIYNKTKVPEQWLVPKTIPIFKNKGHTNDIEDYRPIVNLCVTPKIFLMVLK
jgi:hypothetical protein